MQARLSSHQFMEEKSPFSVFRTTHGYGNTPLIHGHDFIELVYVISGYGKHYFEGTEYEIRAGDVFVINPGEEHTYRFEPESEIEIINCIFQPTVIHDALLKELDITHTMDFFYVHPFLDNNERFHHRLNLQGEHAERILNILENMIRETDGQRPGYPTVIRLQLVELMIVLSRYYNENKQMESDNPSANVAIYASKEQTIVARRILGYIERNCGRKITLNDLADIFHLSTRHINRIVKNEAGMSVVEFLQRARIDKAKRLLRDTDKKMIHVAAAVGYEEYGFFSKLFKRSVGYSPGQYRSKHR